MNKFKCTKWANNESTFILNIKYRMGGLNPSITCKTISNTQNMELISPVSNSHKVGDNHGYKYTYASFKIEI